MNKKFSLYMFIAITLWAGSWVSGKLISGGEFQSQFIFWRFAITSVCYLAIHQISVRNSKEYLGIGRIFKNPALTGLIILSAIALVGYNIMFILGLKSGLAGKGGVIVTTLNPLIGFILGTLLYRNKFSTRIWLGMILGLLGGIILIEPWKYSLSQLIDGGNLIFVAAAGFWALITALGHKIQKDVSLWEFNLLTYTIAIFLTIPFIWNKDIFNMQQYTAGFWINTLYLAVMAGTIAGGMYFYASKVIGSARAGSFTFIVPGMALLFSFIFLKEIPQLTTVVGGALAVTAVYIINRKK
ncbi:MAG: DMT family transporter [Spirochaetia bacterium]|jgi:drug/metabolite transporter (DMT)-like permease|nr:DMT family transporter [Spirochaetia bacterium]